MKGSILITGAAKGIGRASTILFSEMGFRVFAGVRKKEDAIELSKINDLIVPVILDITNREMITEVYHQVKKQTKELMAIVNNAGSVFAGPLEFLPESTVRAQLEDNLLGHLAVTQTFLPLVREGHGRIVMVGSMSSLVAHPLLGAYNISKFGLKAMADTFRYELLPWGISVSLVNPGCHATAIWDVTLKKTRDMYEALPARGKKLYGKAIQHTLDMYKDFGTTAGKPENVAKAIAHAILSRHPRRIYKVGKDINTLVLMSKILPGKFLDKMLCGIYGIELPKPHRAYSHRVDSKSNKYQPKSPHASPV